VTRPAPPALVAAGKAWRSIGHIRYARFPLLPECAAAALPPSDSLREKAMIVTVFRSRLRADADMAALEQMGSRMYELASAMPGFVSYKDFSAPDGETLTLVEFETEEQLLAWRHQPEHLLGQARARAEFFDEYHIAVCVPRREYRFSQAEGRVVML
jgi:heme-degrading monooxygenase HmoA